MEIINEKYNIAAFTNKRTRHKTRVTPSAILAAKAVRSRHIGGCVKNFLSKL